MTRGFCRQASRFDAGILTYGKENRRRMAAKGPVRWRFDGFQTGPGSSKQQKKLLPRRISRSRRDKSSRFCGATRIGAVRPPLPHANTCALLITVRFPSDTTGVSPFGPPSQVHSTRRPLPHSQRLRLSGRGLACVLLPINGLCFVAL